jgi:diguanylate cyclase (GGDEF)-like protein/PAS domain S-box-containing protein
MTNPLLEEFIENAPIAVVAFHADGSVSAWNLAAEQVFGWSRAEVMGRGCPFLETPDDVFAGVLATALRGDDAAARHVGARRKDGAALALDASLSPQRDGTGQVTGAIAVLGNVTENVEVKAALRASEERFRSYVENAPDAILLVDRTGRILEANPAASRILGYPPEVMLTRSIWDGVDPHPGAVATARAHFERVAITGAAFGEVPLRRGDGSTLIADIHAVAVPQGLLAFIRDVTAHRVAEQQLQLYARVFESTSEAVLITDAENRIVSANRAFSEITGWKLEEVVGKNPRLLSSGRQDRAFYERLWQALAEEGRWQGEIWNRRKNGQVFPEWVTIDVVRDPQQRVTNHLAVFSDITEIKASEERVAWLAHHDSLTGLPNRALVRDRLSQAMASARRDSEMVAVAMVDLDGFKTINDSLGHPAGDKVLEVVAERLRHLVRASDTVSRMGGDEFLIAIPGLSRAEDALVVVEKAIASIAEPMQLGPREINVTASAGIAVFPGDGKDLETLLRNADAAMYAAKERGRNTHRFFTADMNARALERLTVVQALRRALERGEFHLVFQPQLRLDSGKVVGVESLIRWVHPELGLVSPVRFIPAAEEAGLIGRIGEWVLREACLQARKWEQAGAPLGMAVNVSAIQFQYSDFFGSVTRILRECGLDPKLLELEITESALMRDASSASQTLRDLRDLGVRVAIDDFGTGYSSLSQLKSLPIERLKIDRSFVRDVLTNPSDLEIVKAIIALGHTLDMEVIAEGVESGSQLTLLEELQCDLAQGYHLGRPMRLPELEAALVSNDR